MTEPRPPDNPNAPAASGRDTSILPVPRLHETWRAAGFAAAAGAALLTIVAATVLVLARPDTRGKDFLATAELAQLKSQFAQNPKDKPLAERIRQLDLDLRRQYFAHLTLARYGNWLLLACLVVFVASARAAIALRPHRPEVGGKQPDFQAELRRSRGRRWAVGAVAALLLAGGLAPAAIEAYVRMTTVAPPPPHVPDEALVAKYWTQFRGPGAQGRGAYDNVPTAWDAPAGRNVLWRSPVPVPGKGSPVVWGKKIFLTGGTKDVREVLCYDADTGRLLWATPIKDIPGTPARIKEPYASTGYAASTPVVDDLHVFALFVNGDLACLDHDGKVVWTKAMGQPNNPYSHGSSLAMCRNLLIVLWDQGTLEDYMSKIFAFDAQTGRVVWQQRRAVSASWATPAVVRVGAAEQLLTAANPWMISYDPATGSELWRAKTLAGGDVASTPAYADGVAYSICAETHLSAVKADGSGDVTASKLLWKSDKGRTDLTSPLTDGKLVWTIETGGKLTCFDAKTGQVAYENEMKSSFNASPSLCAGKLWLLNLKGQMFVCESGRQFKLLATNPLGEAAYASPAFQDGRIYLRGKKNLYCIAQGAQSAPATQPSQPAGEGDNDQEESAE
jgi:outer membrane protein assembly factor BamB